MESHRKRGVDGVVPRVRRRLPRLPPQGDQVLTGLAKIRDPQLLYRLFKYTVYALLTYNGYLFFLDDLAASAQTFGDTVTWRNVVEAYSATIDTSAWILLLLLFELETAVIPDRYLQGALKYVLAGVRGICYFFIVYAFYGYCVKYGVITDLLPLTAADLCSLADSGWAYVAELDDYPLIDAGNCAALQGQAFLQVAGTQIIGTPDALRTAGYLAITDIVNAGTWILVVVMLEAEVWMQLKGMLGDAVMLVFKYLKIIFYSLLFLCAVYWGIDGTFLDFWDAFLWLVAFIFIELNIFQWHEEIEEAGREGAISPDLPPGR